MDCVKLSIGTIRNLTMDKPLSARGTCEICHKDITFIQNRKPPDYLWEKVTVKYETAWNLDGVEESISVDYQLCYECFFYKIGLPPKDWTIT